MNNKLFISKTNNEEWESWQETLEILSDKELIQGIREGFSDLIAGRVFSHQEVFNQN